MISSMVAARVLLKKWLKRKPLLYGIVVCCTVLVVGLLLRPAFQASTSGAAQFDPTTMPLVDSPLGQLPSPAGANPPGQLSAKSNVLFSDALSGSDRIVT